MYYKNRSIWASGIYEFFDVSKEYILITLQYKHNSE